MKNKSHPQVTFKWSRVDEGLLLSAFSASKASHVYRIARIKCLGIEQALRYAVILLDIADESKEDFDELLIERSSRGNYWIHFAVRPPSQVNRRKIRFIQA